MFHCVHFEAPSEIVKRVSGGSQSSVRGANSAPGSPQGLSASPSTSQNVVAASMDVNVSQDFLEEPESERMDNLSDR